MSVKTGTIDMKGDRVLVTGSGRGIGRGMAETFAAWGASVAIFDTFKQSVDDTCAALSVHSGKTFGAVVDVTNEALVRDGVEAAWKALGGIDLLVNNAGVLSVAPVAELALDEWRRVLEVNATGTFLMSRAVVRTMLRHQRGGSIVSIASIGGKRGDPGIAHYAASKFAVIGFTQALAREVAKHDVLVNAVCPGVVQTQMIVDMARQAGVNPTDWINNQSIRRSQTPRDIAFATAFLHHSRAMTGQAINVDGGAVFN
jgi:meso-butanediol dehydrogenase / (S,S)-butanediol dehydrogenase / diacetyl reductase